MKNFCDRPFLNRDFSPRGGGIDYLGMRWVNLSILANWLIPGINNVTGDVGTYALGTWIPWKFRQLCSLRHQDFRESVFRRFRESLEVCISEAIKDGTQATETHGVCFTRMGARQTLDSYDDDRTFDGVGRSNSTSIYAAVQYGPSLRALGLLAGHALAADGGATMIPLAADDSDTSQIVETVEACLQASGHYSLVDSLEPEVLDQAQIAGLGLGGLHPGCYANAGDRFARAFLGKLCPVAVPNGRTLTARLTVATLRQRPGLDATELRNAWYTGMLPGGTPLFVDGEDELLVDQCSNWAVFMGRQYQRYVVELFMRCFELALSKGAGSVTEVVEYAFAHLSRIADKNSTFCDLQRTEVERLQPRIDPEDASRAWNEQVHGDHSLFEGRLAEKEQQIEDLDRAFVMLARWRLRTSAWLSDDLKAELLSLGGRDRLGMRWFHEWVMGRQTEPLEQMLHGLFSEIVFAQHLRIAISRLDGKSQRLRFVLGDHGLEPTTGFAGKMGEKLPAWMEDRLHSFLRLLTDLQVIDATAGGYAPGPRSEWL